MAKPKPELNLQQGQTDKTHNMVMLTVTRQDGDPLLCPIMSAGVLVGASQSSLVGGAPTLVVNAVPVACAGAVCAIWDRKREKCSQNREDPVIEEPSPLNQPRILGSAP